MKKLTTMLGLLALGCSSVVAAAVNPGVRNDLKVTGVTEAFKTVAPMAKSTAVDDGETIGTREYTDRAGRRWDAIFQLWKQPLCNMLTFSDDNGQPYKPSFDELPYYVVSMTLTCQNPADPTPSTMITYLMEWPSMYIYDQVWDYYGELDENGLIPVALRNYEVVPFDTMWNSEDRCREFRENLGVGVGEPVNGDWSYFCMIPNEIVGRQCLYEDKPGYTVCTETVYSVIRLSMFDADESLMEFNANMRINIAGIDRNPRCDYVGTGDVQGFIETQVDVPEFGDLHLFNAGQISSEMLGDVNPFPADFPQFTKMYFAIGDKSIIDFQIDPKVKAFDSTAITTLVGGDDVNYRREHTNYLRGFTFMDKKYADTSLNPDEADCSFSMGPLDEIDLGNDEYYFSYTPELNSLVPFYVLDMNGEYEPWSLEYGTEFSYQAMLDVTANTPVNFGWGYRQGFLLSYENDYLRTYKANSTGKLYYHYNPDDMHVYRELELIGGKDAVETVAADAAKISAANGVITVVAADNANVAVFGLDGVCLKNVKATAGEAVNVEAAKGIYVVTVNGASKKVAL